MKWTADLIAREIVHYMSDDDISTFDPDSWRSGVGSMLQGDWEDFDLNEVLGAMETFVSVERQKARWRRARRVCCHRLAPK